MNFLKPCLALREQDKQRKKEASKKSRKRSSDAEDGSQTKRPVYKGVGRHGSQTKVKKFCKNCKESGGRYWTHNTEDCFVKDRAESRKKESNVMDKMQKQMIEMTGIIQALKSKLSSDGEYN